PRDAILDRARRVVGLELGPDADRGIGRKALELDQRRVADGLDDVPVATPARLVLEERLSHYFRKCSPLRPRQVVIRRAVARGIAGSREGSKQCPPCKTTPARRASPRSSASRAIRVRGGGSSR